MFLTRLLLVVWLFVFPAFGQTVATTNCSKSSDLRVYRAIMDPHNVRDIFGTRIAKRYVAIQVTISNQCKDHQFLIHDLSLDLTEVIPAEVRTKLEQQRRGYELSSEELSILRGVAEKGQVLDKRNRILRLLTAAGAIAGGITGITRFGSSFAPSVAAFNGPVVTAMAEAFPDFTINQMIRLSDSAYISNALVPKQQAKVIVVFIPQAVFLNKKQRKMFWDEPTGLLPPDPTRPPPPRKEPLTAFDYRLIEVLVDGNFITEVEEPEPLPTAAVISPAEMAKLRNARATAEGVVIGRRLAHSEIKLLNTNLGGATAGKKGTPTDGRLEFTLNGDTPIPSGTVLEFEITNEHGSRKTITTIQYPAAAPATPPAPPAAPTPPEPPPN